MYEPEKLQLVSHRLGEICRVFCFCNSRFPASPQGSRSRRAGVHHHDVSGTCGRATGVATDSKRIWECKTQCEHSVQRLQRALGLRPISFVQSHHSFVLVSLLKPPTYSSIFSSSQDNFLSPPRPKTGGHSPTLHSSTCIIHHSSWNSPKQAAHLTLFSPSAVSPGLRSLSPLIWITKERLVISLFIGRLL